MKALENKTMDSKREIDILNALDEIRAVNAKHAKARLSFPALAPFFEVALPRQSHRAPCTPSPPA